MYRSNCCDPKFHIQLTKDDFKISELVSNYIKELFETKSLSKEIRESLFKHYLNKLSKAIDKGYNSTSKFYDEDLAKSLQNNIAQFSAFKEASFAAQLKSILSEKGNLSWSDFKKKAEALNSEYNNRWLETEYHHTIATAVSVEKWKSFEADADLYPNLKYNAVNDSRTREKHRLLDGFIAPITDPIWKIINTPNDWGCRCNLEQTDEDPTGKVPELDIKPMFKNNAALSGEIFGEIPYKEGISKAEATKIEKTFN